MVSFDEETITTLSSEIFHALERLRELVRLPKEKFITDPHTVASAKYFLIVAIEAVIDMCNHAISRNRFRVPNNYADTFKVMEENGFLRRKFAERLMEWPSLEIGWFTSTGISTMR